MRQHFSSILCGQTIFGVQIRQSDFRFPHSQKFCGVHSRQSDFLFTCGHLLRMRFFFATISGSVTSPNNALRGSRLPSSPVSIFLFILAVQHNVYDFDFFKTVCSYKQFMSLYDIYFFSAKLCQPLRGPLVGRLQGNEKVVSLEDNKNYTSCNY